MGIISTKELLDRYSKSLATPNAKIIMSQIDNPKLYDYEKKIGKELIDMDVEDLFGLILELRNKRKDKEVEYILSPASYDQLSSLLRAIFNFYIDNIQLIRNPLNDKRMKGKAAMMRLAKGKKTLSRKEIERIIKEIHKDYDEDNADYIELIMLLFYDGFSTAEEIATLKENMINHEDKTVQLENRTVRLSDRCYDLLMKFNDIETISGYRGNFALKGWRNGFFKFIIRPNQKLKFDDRSIEEVCCIINKCISKKINDKYDTKINYRLLNMLGFYDYILKKHGEKRTNEMILSFRNADDVAELMKLSAEYGMPFYNISYLKKNLWPFVEMDGQ